MDKVYCPWCGAEMFYFERRTKGYWVMGYYLCRACESRAPRIDNIDIDAADMKAAALTAAMRRWQPDNRGLDKCELKPGKVYWLETIGTGFRDGYVRFDGWEIAGFKENEHERDPYARFSGCGYDGCAEWTGVNSGQWRAWLRRPTDAEREAVKWG